MALKVWNVGDVVTATDVNTYMGQQTIYNCTSSTRPTGANRVTGKHIFETDTKYKYYWDGSQWVEYYRPNQVTSYAFNGTTTMSTTSWGYNSNLPATAAIKLPTNGSLEIIMSAFLDTGGGSATGYVGYEITGSYYLAPSKNRSISCGIGRGTFTRHDHTYGMSAGNVYVRPMIIVDSGTTLNIQDFRLIVKPSY